MAVAHVSCRPARTTVHVFPLAGQAAFGVAVDQSMVCVAEAFLGRAACERKSSYETDSARGSRVSRWLPRAQCDHPVSTTPAGKSSSPSQPDRVHHPRNTNLTEMVYGGRRPGDTLVATVDTSNFPPEARAVPRIGDYQRLDIERILSLKPDLVLVWLSGNTNRELGQLEAAGLRVFYLEPRKLADMRVRCRGSARCSAATATASAAPPACAASSRRCARAMPARRR
jgi:hypothetical protein